MLTWIHLLDPGFRRGDDFIHLRAGAIALLFAVLAVHAVVNKYYVFLFGSTSRSRAAASRSIFSVVFQSTQASVTEQP